MQACAPLTAKRNPVDTGALSWSHPLHPVSSDPRAHSRTAVWLSRLTFQTTWAMGKETFQILYPSNVKEPNFQQKHLHAPPQSCIPSTTAGLEDQEKVSLRLDKPAYDPWKGGPDNSSPGPAKFFLLMSRWVSGCPKQGVGSTVTWWARDTREGVWGSIWTWVPKNNVDLQDSAPKLQASPSRHGDHQSSEGRCLLWASPGPPHPCPDSTKGQRRGHSCTVTVFTTLIRGKCFQLHVQTWGQGSRKPNLRSSHM